METDFENSISIMEVLFYVKNNIWLIVFCAISGILLGLTLTVLLEKNTYQSKSTVIMSKEATRIFYDDEYTKSDIDLYEQVGNTYIKIAQSNIVLDNAIKLLEQEPSVNRTYTRTELKEIVTAKYNSGTLFFEITATSTAGDNVCAIANAYSDSFIEQGNLLLPAAYLSVVDRAETPKEPNPSKLNKNIITGFMFGVIVACGVIALRIIYDRSRLQTQGQVQFYLDIPLVIELE